MVEISYFYYDCLLKNLNNDDINNILNEYCKKIILLAKIDIEFKNYILNKKFNLRYILPLRAKEIIITANPSFNKYYAFYENQLEFWISDEPYFHYIVDMRKMTDSIRKEKIKILKMLLKDNNFIEL